MNLAETLALLVLFLLSGVGVYFLIIKNKEKDMPQPPSQQPKYSCVTYSNGGSGCVQDDNGVYATPAECAAACSGPVTKTETVISTIPYYGYGVPNYVFRTGYPYRYRPIVKPFPRPLRR